MVRFDLPLSTKGILLGNLTCLLVLQLVTMASQL